MSDKYVEITLLAKDLPKEDVERIVDALTGFLAEKSLEGSVDTREVSEEELLEEATCETVEENTDSIHQKYAAVHSDDEEVRRYG